MTKIKLVSCYTHTHTTKMLILGPKEHKTFFRFKKKKKLSHDESFNLKERKCQKYIYTATDKFFYLVEKMKIEFL